MSLFLLNFISLYPIMFWYYWKQMYNNDEYISYKFLARRYFTSSIIYDVDGIGNMCKQLRKSWKEVPRSSSSLFYWVKLFSLLNIYAVHAFINYWWYDTMKRENNNISFCWNIEYEISTLQLALSSKRKILCHCHIREDLCFSPSWRSKFTG